MPLDPQVQAYLEQAAKSAGTPMHLQTPQQARDEMLTQTAALGPGEPLAKIEDCRIPGQGGEVPLRIYTPGEKVTGVLVYFHGGGWVIGGIATHDQLCRSIANAAGSTVVSVEYRLAPEHKYPAAVDDAYTATCWAVENARRLGAEPRQVAVGGDSAGGNLAAVACLVARDRGGPRLACQVLLYPIADSNLETRSYLDYADGYLLTRDAMAWFWNHYLSHPEQARDSYVSPLAAESVSGLPPALVITAEYDPLRDEGEAYARRLQAEGVPTVLSRYDGMIHGFVRRSMFFEAGLRALAEISQVLRAAFAEPSAEK